MGAERAIVHNAVFLGHHDNILLKVQILLSRNAVVIAQAPSFEMRVRDPFLGDCASGISPSLQTSASNLSVCSGSR